MPLMPLIAAVPGPGDAGDGDLRGLSDPNVGVQSSHTEHRRGLLSRSQHLSVAEREQCRAHW